VTSYADLVDVRDGVWQVPEGWRQGRGAWGGLVVAAAVRAARSAGGPQEPPLREVSVHMVGPVPSGAARVACQLVRRGSSTAVWDVSIGSAAGETWAVATVVLGAPRALDVPGRSVLAMPEVPDWRDMEPLILEPPLAPEFLQHLAVRPVSGYPYSGTGDDVLAWVAPTVPLASYDDATLTGMVDALWPATLVQVETARPMATLSFSATLLVDPATVDAGAPLLHRGRLLAMAEGYATESRELWTADGRLAVHNSQVIAVIR
jgi:hypothetical protein